MSNTIEKWKVYKLVSPSGRVYIGCTKLPIDKRWQSGRNYKSNKELFDDIVKYGWDNFAGYILTEYDDEIEAREREHIEIQNYPDGYNIYRGNYRNYDPNWQPVKKPVLCVETGVIYESIYDAAKQTGLAKNKISYCCRGIRNKTGGFHWKFA